MMLVVKSPPANAGDARNVVSIPDGGRSPGEGNGNPLQYSCLENPMDRGDWWAIVHGISKSQTWLRCLSIALKGKETVWGEEMEARKSLVWLENTHCLVALGPAANDRNCIEQGGCCQVGGCLEVFAKFGYCSIEKRVFSFPSMILSSYQSLVFEHLELYLLHISLPNVQLISKPCWFALHNTFSICPFCSCHSATLRLLNSV